MVRLLMQIPSELDEEKVAVFMKEVAVRLLSFLLDTLLSHETDHTLHFFSIEG